MEGVVHFGWLVKSPPEKRIIRGKWRHRWFVLRHSGLLPGQFILEYFVDNSCKKLRGRIDLDQCEQVDAGITFDSKRTNYQHMFDVRTPKRTYYLVAETEADMNKWVQCICQVCGLKIHMDEDFLVPRSISSTGPITNTSIILQPTTSTTDTKSNSNPYIPISECHTGKPVLNGGLPHDSVSLLNNNSTTESLEGACSDVPKDPPPPPPRNENSPSPSNDDFYDRPRPLNKISGSSIASPNLDEFYKVPLQMKRDPSGFATLPPRVNWDTYPEDSFASNCSTMPKSGCSLGSEDVSVYDVVPTHPRSIKEAKAVQKKVHSLANHFEKMGLQKSAESQPKKPADSELNKSQDADAAYMNQPAVVPPRPPKPSKMRDRHRYENYELPHQSLKDEEKNDPTVPSKEITSSLDQTVQPPKSEREESSETAVDASSSKEVAVDDTYDFPKFRWEENINAPVPVPQSTGTTQRARRHAYTNAAPGLFNNKDLIFNYECRPSLLTSDYCSADGPKSVQSNSNPPSPSSLGAYANVPTTPQSATNLKADTLPPAVNRELKPKRLSTSDDKGSFSFLTLQPPPVCRSRTKANKRSFRKPSPTPPSSNNGMPPVPNRFRHHPEISPASDDEVSNSSGSRRNSSNDDQVKHFFPGLSKKDEIQYLDLDLDSEPSPSPKTPERLAASTVYKKVDFVKTKAFNEMRQNVEETYRKSQ